MTTAERIMAGQGAELRQVGAIDALRQAASDVFDTGMDAGVARWLEARALLLERGRELDDADALDAAIRETTLAAMRRHRLEAGEVAVSRVVDGGDIVCACGNSPTGDGLYQCTEDGALLDDVGHEHAPTRNLYRCESCGRIHDYDALENAGDRGLFS